MPQNKTCIRCGAPSDTTVCMPCFFKYDYKTYEPHILKAEPNHNQEKNLLESNQSTLVQHVNQQQTQDHNASPNQTMEHGKDNSITTWFSRLPHLS